jgi:hypothetical protein
LISVLGFEHGQLVEIGAQVDRLGMQQELGVLASLGQTAPEATT